MGKAIDEVSKERLSDRYDPRSEKLDDRKGLEGLASGLPVALCTGLVVKFTTMV